MPVSDYDPIIQEASQEWNVDPVLLKALITHESGGNPNAKSKANAGGLTQIIPLTAQGLGMTDPKDPTQQIFGGAKYLSEGLDKEGTVPGALLYYHGGPDWRNQYGPESAGYVPAVAAQYKRLSAGQQQPTAPNGESATPSDDDFLKTIAPSTSAASSSPPSDDDFLSSLPGAKPAEAPVTGTIPTMVVHPSAPATESGEVAAAPAAAPAQRPIVPNDIDANGQPITPSAPPPSTPIPVIEPVAKAIAQGAAQGFGSSPLGLAPASVNALQNSGIYPPQQGGGTPVQYLNRALIGPAATIGDLALRSGNALLRGAQSGISQLGAEAPQGPSFSANSSTPLGRYVDESLTSLLSPQQAARAVASLPEAFPTGSTNGSLISPRVPSAEANPLNASPRYMTELTAPERVTGQTDISRINQLINHDEAETNPLASSSVQSNGVRTMMGAPSSGWPGGVIPSWAQGAGAPQSGARVTPGQIQARDNVGYNEAVRRAAAENQSIGAAGTPSTTANLSPKLEQAYRSVAEGQKLNEPQPAGAPDYNAYVPRVEPTMAHLEQSANVSREQKMLESQIPEEFKAQAAANNEARQDFFNGLAGSDVDVANAEAARSQQAVSDLQQAFGNKKPVNAQPVAGTINDMLNQPRNTENTQLKQYVAPLLDRLKNPDGTLKNDPEQLYGLRQDIYRMTQKANAKLPTEEGNNLKFITGNLSDVMGSLDNVIEKGAPGYQQYLQNFSAASRPIDAMNTLQGFENKLYDTQGRMQLSRVQTMMKNIVNARAAPGLNPYKSIPDETMAQLWNLRDDLRRVASSEELAKAKGSDTAQNAMDVAKDVAKQTAGRVAEGVLHAGANAIIPGGGSLAVNFGRGVLNNFLSGRYQNQLQRRASEMAHPAAPLNQLQGPP